MKKKELIREVAIRADMPINDTKSVVEHALALICETLEAGEEVNLSGFGVFGTKIIPARMRRNPKTGEPVRTAASCKPVFRAGTGLKNAAARRKI